VYEGDFKLDGGRRAARALVEGAGEMPTAVLAANDMMALGLMQEFRERGVEVPGDVSVVGFDDIAFAGLARAALDDRQPAARGSSAAAPSKRSSPASSTRSIRDDIHVATHLVTRASTGRAPVRFAEGGRVDAGIDTRGGAAPASDL
jgi:LacI family transcriptional regulator